jgi:hypothetical protein
MLQLDRNHTGSFHQLWIIERIMKYGTLWMGNYTRAARDKGPNIGPATGASSPVAGNGTPEQPMIPEVDCFASKILQSQLTKQYLAYGMRLQVESSERPA